MLIPCMIDSLQTQAVAHAPDEKLNIFCRSGWMESIEETCIFFRCPKKRGKMSDKTSHMSSWMSPTIVKNKHLRRLRKCTLMSKMSVETSVLYLPSVVPCRCYVGATEAAQLQALPRGNGFYPSPWRCGGLMWSRQNLTWRLEKLMRTRQKMMWLASSAWFGAVFDRSCGCLRHSLERPLRHP